MMKKILTHIILLFCIGNSFAQQDFLNSQYMFNLYNINPGYTGSKNSLSASLSHRSQWVGFDGAPNTQILGVHAPLQKLNIGVGLQLFNDQIGPRQMNGITTSYAYHLKVGKGKIGLGLRAGAINYTYNWNELDYKDPTDGIIGIGSQSGIKLNFDFGAYYKDKLQFAGIELAHITSPNISKTTVQMKLIPQLLLFYGRAFEINDQLVLKGSLMSRFTDVSGIIDVNLSAFIYKKFWAGVSYRSAGAIIPIVEFYATPSLRFGYSYDHSLGGLQNAQSGSHEIFLGYDLRIFKTEMLSPRYF